MQWNKVGMSLDTPGGTIDFDVDGDNTYFLDATQCTGLDMVPLRAPIDDAPVTDGGIVHPFFKTARHITLGGVLLVIAGIDDTTYLEIRNALEGGLNAALESIQSADGTLTWTPTGGSLQTLTVRCDITANYSGVWTKNFIFGLVAANPVPTGGG